MFLLGGLLGCAPHAPRDTAAGDLVWRFLDPAIACDDAGNVYVAGAEQFGTHAQIFVATSNRYGEEWNARFHYLNHSQAGERGRPQLAAGAAGEIYVLWEDTRNGEVELFLNRSLDGGANWLAQDVPVSGAEPGSRVREPVLRCDRRGNVFVVWRDAREGFDALYFSRSHDRGTQWLHTAHRLSRIGLARKWEPSLACDEQGGVYVAWVEREGTEPALYVNTSADHGDTWAFEPRRVNPRGATRVYTPALCANDAGLVLASWLEIHGNRAEIRLARSPNRGHSWDPEPAVLRAQGGPHYDPSVPQVQCDRTGHVYVGWQVTTSAGAVEFVIKSSADDARSFVETRLPRSEGAFPAVRSEPTPTAPFRMCADQVGNLYLSWTDAQGAAASVGFERLTNHGQTWLGLPRTVGLAGHRPLSLEPPALSADDFGHVYLLWNEGRTLTVAASPFYGDSGWRYEHF